MQDRMHRRETEASRWVFERVVQEACLFSSFWILYGAKTLHHTADTVDESDPDFDLHYLDPHIGAPCEHSVWDTPSRYAVVGRCPRVRSDQYRAGPPGLPLSGQGHGPAATVRMGGPDLRADRDEDSAANSEIR